MSFLMLTGLDALVLTAVPLDFVYTIVLIAHQYELKEIIYTVSR